MPAAEARGLAAQVDAAVLAQACRHIAGTPADAGFVSVNLSLEFVLAPDFGDRIRRALDLRHVDPSRLVLELTEAVTLQLPRAARRDIESLDEDGVRIFVDDFGSGYGALAVFDDLPVRGVKLDRSLLTGAESDPRRDVLLVGLRHLVDGLGVVGVVEGIETPDELDRVRSIGWTLGQGYLLGARPSAPSDPAVRAGSAPGGGEPAGRRVVGRMADRRRVWAIIGRRRPRGRRRSTQGETTWTPTWWPSSSSPARTSPGSWGCGRRPSPT